MTEPKIRPIDRTNRIIAVHRCQRSYGFRGSRRTFHYTTPIRRASAAPTIDGAVPPRWFSLTPAQPRSYNWAVRRTGIRKGAGIDERDEAVFPGPGRCVSDPPPQHSRRSEQAARIHRPREPRRRQGRDHVRLHFDRREQAAVPRRSQPRRDPRLPGDPSHRRAVRPVPRGARNRDRQLALLHRRIVQPARPPAGPDPGEAAQPDQDARHLQPHLSVRARLIRARDHPNSRSRASRIWATPTSSTPPASSTPARLALGRITRRNPSFAASAIRLPIRLTARTSPPSPTSPTTTVPGSVGRSRCELATAAATPKSAAGSSTRTPPATLT